MKTNRSTKTASDVFELFESEKEFCDNQFCENEAVKTVPVSVKRAGDSKRKFCGSCYEAYVIGVQHGRISENPRAYSRNGARRARLRKSGKSGKLR
jgi:hypothetical protein